MVDLEKILNALIKAIQSVPAAQMEIFETLIDLSTLLMYFAATMTASSLKSHICKPISRQKLLMKLPPII